MKLTTLFKLLASLFFVALITAGCADNNAEEAGEEIDEAITDASNAIEDACEEVKEGVKAEDTDC
ncbi:hypothetical protein [Planctobacterium marinum]|uniref:hypothetical protein n=1 Tax=Planctobacterium marinum TaxID=1631968 RepID=UPI001E40AFEA|nr:hypothetical protein [Planctobacterium marinum]MCC2606965.1 hypothetical protein [Planctobacterium marinum]